MLNIEVYFLPPEEFWIAFGTGNSQCFIPIHKIANIYILQIYTTKYMLSIAHVSCYDRL
jgi:hypothetical protein